MGGHPNLKKAERGFDKHSKSRAGATGTTGLVVGRDAGVLSLWQEKICTIR